MDDDCAIILLAAGVSRRMGRPKQTLPYEGQSLLRRAAGRALQARIGRVYVVLAEDDRASTDELHGLSISIVRNPHAPRGIGTSIRAGIGALPASVEAALILLVDQPKVTAEVLVELRDLLSRDPRAVAAACRYAGAPGVPAIFRRDLFGALARLPDDSGAKGLLLAHAARVLTIDFPPAGFDIDQPGDLPEMRDA